MVFRILQLVDISLVMIWQDLIIQCLVVIQHDLVCEVREIQHWEDISLDKVWMVVGILLLDDLVLVQCSGNEIQQSDDNELVDLWEERAIQQCEEMVPVPI